MRRWMCFTCARHTMPERGAVQVLLPRNITGGPSQTPSSFRWGGGKPRRPWQRAPLAECAGKPDEPVLTAWTTKRRGMVSARPRCRGILVAAGVWGVEFFRDESIPTVPLTTHARSRLTAVKTKLPESCNKVLLRAATFTSKPS